MLDLFSCSDLVNCLFYFTTGLPVKTKEEELMESDDLDSSHYQSRLSMSIEGGDFQIGRRLKDARSGQGSTQRDSNASRGSGGGVRDNALLGHFHAKMQMINF